MTTGPRIRACETMRGWWATAVRVLSLVLVMALVVPGAIHSSEAHRSAGHALSMSASPDASGTDHADACPACHANCGCHQAIGLEGSAWVPTASTSRPSYVTVDVAIASVASDRLPRPPRA
jgi:hypothetical protein